MYLGEKILSKSGQFNYYKSNYSILTKKNDSLKADNTLFKSEIESLKLENKFFRNENDELIIKNKELQSKYETAKSEINSLRMEYETAKSEIDRIKNLIPDSDMFKKQNRGSSGEVGKTIFMDWILNNIDKEEKILDIGFGAGVYGKILKAFYYKHIDGVDIWPKDIEEMGLNYIYDNIFISDVSDFEFEHYDLIIMGDVLEHMSLKDSQKLLNRYIDDDLVSKMFIQVPYEYENHNAWYGNPNEVHIQDEINDEYMKEHFPFLQLLQIDRVPHHTTALGRKTGHDTFCATYIWSKNDK